MPDQDDTGIAQQGASAGDAAPAAPPRESVVEDLGGPPTHASATGRGRHATSIDQPSFVPSSAEVLEALSHSSSEFSTPGAAAREFLAKLGTSSDGHLKPDEPSGTAEPEPLPLSPPPDVVDPDPASRRKKVLAAMAAVGLTGAAILAIALNQGGGKTTTSAHSNSPAPGAAVGAPPAAAAADASGPLRTSGAFNGPLTPQGPVHCYQGELNHAQFTASDGTPMFISTSARLVDILTSNAEFRGTGSITRKALAIMIADVQLTGQGKSLHLTGTVTCGQ